MWVSGLGEEKQDGTGERINQHPTKPKRTKIPSRTSTYLCQHLGTKGTLRQELRFLCHPGVEPLPVSLHERGQHRLGQVCRDADLCT